MDSYRDESSEKDISKTLGTTSEEKVSKSSDDPQSTISSLLSIYCYGDSSDDEMEEKIEDSVGKSETTSEGDKFKDEDQDSAGNPNYPLINDKSRLSGATDKSKEILKELQDEELLLDSDTNEETVSAEETEGLSILLEAEDPVHWGEIDSATNVHCKAVEENNKLPLKVHNLSSDVSHLMSKQNQDVIYLCDSKKSVQQEIIGEKTHSLPIDAPTAPTEPGEQGLQHEAQSSSISKYNKDSKILNENNILSLSGSQNSTLQLLSGNVLMKKTEEEEVRRNEDKSGFLNLQYDKDKAMEKDSSQLSHLDEVCRSNVLSSPPENERGLIFKDTSGHVPMDIRNPDNKNSDPTAYSYDASIVVCNSKETTQEKELFSEERCQNVGLPGPVYLQTKEETSKPLCVKEIRENEAHYDTPPANLHDPGAFKLSCKPEHSTLEFKSDVVSLTTSSYEDLVQKTEKPYGSTEDLKCSSDLDLPEKMQKQNWSKDEPVILNRDNEDIIHLEHDEVCQSDKYPIEECKESQECEGIHEQSALDLSTDGDAPHTGKAVANSRFNSDEQKYHLEEQGVAIDELSNQSSKQNILFEPSINESVEECVSTLASKCSEVDEGTTGSPFVEIFIEENIEEDDNECEHVETVSKIIHGNDTVDLLQDAGITSIIVEGCGDESHSTEDTDLSTAQRGLQASTSVIHYEENIDETRKETELDVEIAEVTKDSSSLTPEVNVVVNKNQNLKQESYSTFSDKAVLHTTKTSNHSLQDNGSVEHESLSIKKEGHELQSESVASKCSNSFDGPSGSNRMHHLLIPPSKNTQDVIDQNRNVDCNLKESKGTEVEEDEVTITCVSYRKSSEIKAQKVTGNVSTTSSYGLKHHPIPQAPPKPEKPLTPYLRFKKKILPKVKKEVPNLTDSTLNLVVSNQWNMIKEEEKQEYQEEYAQEKAEYQKQMTRYYSSSEYKAWVDAKNTLENAMSCRIKLPKWTETTTQEAGKDDLSKKTGQCSWCKNVGSLSNFSANLQGKEIYCTGLCSQKCFKEASMKICNLENGGSTFGKTNGSVVSQSEESGVAEENISVSARSGQSSPTTNPLTSFVWQQYLQECNSRAAPWQYFRQAQKPLQNDFARGMKLEAKDPRQDEAVCVATVVGILGPRLRLRFDGSDTTNDIWRLTDSEDIHPVGWAEKNGAMLHPPVGFRWDVGKFPEFLTKTLNDAHVAKGELFVETPSTPTDNLFQIGMKLEAVDRVNPALICVATVIDIKEGRIHVEFDGYKGSGYWCHYGDRDIFPAGWCFNNGYPLQPPGKKAYQNLSKEKTSSSVTIPRPVTRTNGDSSNKGTTSTVYEPKESHSPLSAPPSVSDSDLRQHLLNVIVHVNAECHPGPYLNKSKLAKLSKFYSGKGVVVMQTVIEDIINCAHNPKVVFGFLRPVSRKTSCVITSHFDGVQYRCCLPNIEQMSTFWKTLEQFVDNLRCCENLLSAAPVSAPCAKCSKGSTFPFLASGMKRGVISYSSLSSVPSLTFQSSSPVTASAGRNALGSPVVTTSGPPVNGLNGDGPLMKRTKLDSSPVEINKPPRLWTIEEVAKFIEQTDIREHAGVFKMNEIDGKALLLLRRDIVINYMGFKLGPAVKLLEIVDELREAQKTLSAKI